ncbi:MAG: thioredoxin family protein [Saprospiraceae bacterium]|nr:thioredoxin family protein [Saprospiraceae bacterium]
MKRHAPPVLLLACFILFLSAGTPRTYVVGDQVANFSLLNIDGRMVSMHDYTESAKGLIVVFTCNHCPYAQLYEQRIIDLHNKYAQKGFPVIAINPNPADLYPDDSYEEMQKRAKEMRYPFAYLHDDNQTVYPQFGASRTPHVFILDDNFIVRYIGAIDDNPETPKAAKNRFVENAVNAMLRGERPDPEFTRAVGCTIKKKP